MHAYAQTHPYAALLSSIKAALNSWGYDLSAKGSSQAEVELPPLEKDRVAYELALARRLALSPLESASERAKLVVGDLADGYAAEYLSVILAGWRECGFVVTGPAGPGEIDA